MSLYKDRLIECNDEALVIRWYYFPIGSKKTIPYTEVRSFTKFKLAALRGKFRIWGTGNLRYWANLDPARPKKSSGLTLDLGKRIKPFITPDDPEAVAEILTRRTGRTSEGSPPPFV